MVIPGVVWSDNTKVVAKPWGDFTAVVVGELSRLVYLAISFVL